MNSEPIAVPPDTYWAASGMHPNPTVLTKIAKKCQKGGYPLFLTYFWEPITFPPRPDGALGGHFAPAGTILAGAKLHSSRGFEVGVPKKVIGSKKTLYGEASLSPP